MDQSLLYILVFVMSALILLLIGVAVSYINLMIKFSRYKEGREKDIDPATLLAQAREKSEEILKDAHKKSLETISKAEDFLKRDEGVITQELTQTTSKYNQLYQETLKAVQAGASEQLQNLPNDLKLTMVSAIDNFRKSLSVEITKAQEETRNTIKEAYSKASMEIEKYKEDRMKQIDASILSVIKEVTEKVLGKSISYDEHEKLVQKALEESKKKNIF